MGASAAQNAGQSQLAEPRLGALPLLYLVWALPLLFALCWLQPPWQSPDEAAQLLRADQVAHGGVLGQRRGADAGGFADAAIAQSAAVLSALPFHPERKLTAAALAQADAMPWGQRTFLSFPNTAQYPPVPYLPQAIAVRLGQAASLSVDLTLRLARLANAIAAALVTAAALCTARRTQAVLALLAMLPMSLALFASASQDALLIACMLLAVGLLDRSIAAQRDCTGAERLGVIVLLGLVATARLAYAPFALLGLLTTRRLTPACLSATALVLAVALGWAALVTIWIGVPMHGADPAAQLRFILAHPAGTGTIVVTTFRQWAELWIDELIGRTGWLDTLLAPWFYRLAELLLGLGFIAALGGHSRRPAACAVAWCAAALAAILAILVTWNQVGAPVIRGVQGRYFTPVLAVATLSLPAVPKLARAARPLGLTAVAVMAMTAPMALLKALVWRYDLG